jgi:hypothetical protein
MGVSGHRHASAALYPPGKGPPVPIGQEAGWAPEPVWTQRLEKQIICLCQGSNLDHLVIYSAARHYTDWATRLLHLYKSAKKIAKTNQQLADPKTGLLI